MLEIEIMLPGYFQAFLNFVFNKDSKKWSQIFMRRYTRRKELTHLLLSIFLILFLLSCGSGSDDEDNGSQPVSDLVDLQPLVFMADKDIKGTVELYVSSEAGSDIKKLSGTLVDGGDVVDFRISPDGKFVAYVADQDTNQVFELYVSETDKLIGDSEVKVSGTMAGNGIKEIIRIDAMVSITITTVISEA